MRLVLASLLFAAVVCVSFADDANAPEDAQPGVEVIDKVDAEEIARMKRGGSHETVKVKINDDDCRRHHCRQHSKKSCSHKDETVKIKVAVDDDKSCNDDRHHNCRKHHRCQSKESCSDEDKKVKIKVDGDEVKNCNDDCRRGNNYGKNLQQTLSNTPQIHYHHHNVPVHEVIMYDKGEYGNVEDGNSHYGVDKYSLKQNQNGHHSEYQDQKNDEEDDYPKQGYHPRNRYDEHDRPEESGYQKQGGCSCKNRKEPVVCDSEDTITIVV